MGQLVAYWNEKSSPRPYSFPQIIRNIKGMYTGINSILFLFPAFSIQTILNMELLHITEEVR